MRVASILELRKTILSEKRRCKSTSTYFLMLYRKIAEKKIPSAQRTLVFGKVRSSQAFSGEKLLISVGSMSNHVSVLRHKCMHTEDLRQPGCPAGLGRAVVQSSVQPTDRPSGTAWGRNIALLFLTSPAASLAQCLASCPLSSHTSAKVLPEIIFSPY